MKTLLSEHDTSNHWKTHSTSIRPRNKRQIDYEKLRTMKENWEEMIKLIYLKKQQISWILYNSNKQVIRKLSMIPLKLINLRGKAMKITHEKCTVNPDVVDTYYVDADGIQTLVECANVEAMRKAKEVKRY